MSDAGPQDKEKDAHVDLSTERPLAVVVLRRHHPDRGPQPVSSGERDAISWHSSLSDSGKGGFTR